MFIGPRHAPKPRYKIRQHSPGARLRGQSPSADTSSSPFFVISPFDSLDGSILQNPNSWRTQHTWNCLRVSILPLGVSQNRSLHWSATSGKVSALITCAAQGSSTDMISREWLESSLRSPTQPAAEDQRQSSISRGGTKKIAAVVDSVW